MTWHNTTPFALVLLVTFNCFNPSPASAQANDLSKPETIIIGGELFSVGMTQQEAMKRLEKCCYITGGTDPLHPDVKSFIIEKKDKTDMLGAIWFRAEVVERLVREGEFSQDPGTINFALSLYRLLSKTADSNPPTFRRDGAASCVIVLQTENREISNASLKILTLTFRNGRGIQMELSAPDDTRKLRNSVSLKEILEKP